MTNSNDHRIYNHVHFSDWSSFCHNFVLPAPRSKHIKKQKNLIVRMNPSVFFSKTGCHSSIPTIFPTKKRGNRRTDLHISIVASINEIFKTQGKEKGRKNAETWLPFERFLTMLNDLLGPLLAVHKKKKKEKKREKRRVNLLTQRLFVPRPTRSRQFTFSVVPRKGCALRSGVEIAYTLVYRVISTR